MKRLLALSALMATPAMAAGDYPFFSLRNTDLVVLIGFVIFVGILYYFKVHLIILAQLDKRADGIRSELDEARRLREEALALLASFEKQQSEVKGKSERLIERAREDARIAAEQAKAEMQAALERRVKAARDQIASAEAAAVREVRDKAVRVAIAAAGDVIAQSLSEKEADALIQSSIETVEARLH